MTLRTFTLRLQGQSALYKKPLSRPSCVVSRWSCQKPRKSPAQPLTAFHHVRYSWSVPSTEDPPRRITESDFFGEPVTFLGCDPRFDKIANAMAAMDGFLLAAVSKGRSCIGGGMEHGVEVKGSHSVALSWSEALKFATFWNLPNDINKDNDQNEPDTNSLVKAAPMLAVVAVAPLLVQSGVTYVKHLDSLLVQTKAISPGLPPVQILAMAQCAVDQGQNNYLDDRERMHIKTLELLLKDQHRLALVNVLKILRQCPGDVLALSLAMDLAHGLGDRQAAGEAAGSVIAYWTERQGGLVRPAIPGHATAMSLIALGFAVGGHIPEAEQMADNAMKQGRKICGALATWAQCHVFDAGGRVAEGISALSNFDGKQNYEGAGFLHFDAILSGYGARFSMDREERGRGKSAALRLYGTHFETVLENTGFASRSPHRQPMYKAPVAWVKPDLITSAKEEESSQSESMFDQLFGRNKKQDEMDKEFEILKQQINLPSKRIGGWDPLCEDVLTWLPPTPRFLADATLLLFRFTLNGTIGHNNVRWDDLRNAWEAYFDIHNKYSNEPPNFCPLVSLSACIIMPPSEAGGDRIGSGSLSRGLHKLGKLLNLGNASNPEESKAIREIVAESSPSFWLPNTDGTESEWKGIVHDIHSAIEGVDPDESDVNQSDQDVYRLRYNGWIFDSRPILEHAIVYAACKAGDIESLSIARGICSRGVTLRTMSPEEWWRYSIVLGLLGDQVASEDAWNTSINVGASQGAR